MIYINKLIAILMSIFYMFIGGNLDNVKIKLAEQPTTDSEYLFVKVENYAGKTICIDKSVVLEKEVNGEWIAVPINDGFGFEEISINVRNCNSYTLQINIVETYGHKLEEGHYRISKRLINDNCMFTVTPK